MDFSPLQAFEHVLAIKTLSPSIPTPLPLAFIRSKKQKTLQTVAWGPSPAGFLHLPGLPGPGSGTFLEAGVGEPWILGTG